MPDKNKNAPPIELTDEQTHLICDTVRKLGAGVAVWSVTDEATQELAGFRAALERVLERDNPKRPEGAFARLLLDGADRGEDAARAQIN